MNLKALKHILLNTTLKSVLQFLSTNGKKRQALNRLKAEDRYTKGEVIVDGIKLVYPDALSLYYMWKDIFENELYKFNKSDESPKSNYILDLGANIGLSAIYFSKKYPGHLIHAYEPDPEIFEYLKLNIAQNECSNVKLFNFAVWNETTELTFYSEGADAGTLISASNPISSYSVQSIAFSEILKTIDGNLDMVKVDIEGAETTIFGDSSQNLAMIQNLFVEYHSFLNQAQTLDRLLKNIAKSGLRYQIFNLNDGVRISPLTNKSSYSGMDLQLNIFCTR